MAWELFHNPPTSLSPGVIHDGTKLRLRPWQKKFIRADYRTDTAGNLVGEGEKKRVPYSRFQTNDEKPCPGAD